MNINPHDFFIKVKVCEVPQRWAEAFVEIRRWYVDHQKFNDDRHRLNGMSEYEEVGHVISSRKSVMDGVPKIEKYGNLWDTFMQGEVAPLWRMFMDFDSYTAGNFMRRANTSASIIFFAADRVSRETMATQRLIMCIMQNFYCACESICEYRCRVTGTSECNQRVDVCLDREMQRNTVKMEELMNEDWGQTAITTKFLVEFVAKVMEIVRTREELVAQIKYPLIQIQKDQLFMQSEGVRLCDPLMEDWQNKMMQNLESFKDLGYYY